jgi:hypothetical protein
VIVTVSQRFAWFSVIAACSGALGCADKADLYEDRDWTKEGEAKTAAWREVESLFSREETDADRGNYTLRGVRHDLTLSKDARVKAHCTCLDVSYGSADDPAFRWAGEVPIISPDQVVVALRTEGSKCGPEHTKNRRPSIYAVDQANGNIVVVVEELPADRPQALGAIIDLPAPAEALYVRSRRYKDHVLPYAQGTVQTSGMCKVMTRTRNKATL